MSGMAILENVRRYRTIGSPCRQTSAFRPAQKWTLLAQRLTLRNSARIASWSVVML
jgi:hypothetical protein